MPSEEEQEVVDNFIVRQNPGAMCLFILRKTKKGLTYTNVGPLPLLLYSPYFLQPRDRVTVNWNPY
jgi:hypothetical protein